VGRPGACPASRLPVRCPRHRRRPCGGVPRQRREVRRQERARPLPHMQRTEGRRNPPMISGRDLRSLAALSCYSRTCFHPLPRRQSGRNIAATNASPPRAASKVQADLSRSKSAVVAPGFVHTVRAQPATSRMMSAPNEACFQQSIGRALRRAVSIPQAAIVMHSTLGERGLFRLAAPVTPRAAEFSNTYPARR
jgi:hypothetical protein